MKRLRIAIITEQPNCYAWQNAIINDLFESVYVDIILKIDLNAKIKKQQMQEKNLPLFWKLFLKIDAKFFKPQPDALAIQDNELLNNIPFCEIKCDFNFNRLEDYNIDIILNLTDVIPNKNLINVSKYGVWFLNHCNLDQINKRPYGIWEMLNNSPETAGVLRFIKKGMPFPQTIDQTFACTDGLSYKRNVNSILWQSHLLVKTNIELLATKANLFNNKLNSNANLYSSKNIEVPFSSPSNLKIIGYGLSLYINKLFQLINSQLYFHQWALIFFNNNNNDKNPYELKKYTKILPPKDRFWADPILINHNNKTYLFIEELIYKNKLGHLSVMEIDECGNYTKPEVILLKSYHLSYPFVFQDNNDFYMIPETSSNNDIQLYRATEFPLNWKLEKVIMKDVVAVDTTIYKENDTYWLFTNIKKHQGVSKNVELFLFSSKSLVSDNWQPHPLNPIVTDVKTARPAGSFFKFNNKLYRPSQNCSNHYGYGLNIMEVTTLNNTNFEQKIIRSIKPSWEKNINCTHSFNSLDRLFISDIKIKRKRI